MNQIFEISAVIVAVAVVHWLVRGDAPRQWRLERKVRQSNHARERKLKEWMVQQRMDFDGQMGFSIQDLVVREFNYLLGHVTDGKLERFDDLARIHESHPLIIAGITKEMQHPLEAERNLADLETAQANLRNLRQIVELISRYVEKRYDLNLRDALITD
ncbi:hypothetical protein [Burkholderia cenocepacia]|uniref:hypothetical protein n=1 Tax=Burkholderia cenocepacia TaxID=95486 RepID=UPI00190487C3|nr:hypothetical protein [Burkholderia cenocepacia]MBJ9698620.1 hypothetical protein [Burkholderia cenocepacia]